jgi:hypothetical protein
MGKEQLPEVEAGGHSPGGAVVVAASNAVQVLVALAILYVGDGKGQVFLRDEDLLTVHAIAPLSKWKKRHWVASVGYAMELVGLVLRRDIEALVDVGVELVVAKSRLAKGSHMCIPSARFEVEACKCCNSAAERVSDQDQLVVGKLVQGVGHVRENDLAGVEPGRVEAGVHSAVLALWRMRGRRIFAVLPRREEVGRSLVIVVVARVRHVLLRDGGEVGDGVGDRVGAAEGEDQARVGRRVREGDVAAGVR